MQPRKDSATAKRWGFIGAGKMASALIRGMLRAEVAAIETTCASDPVESVRASLGVETGISVFDTNAAVAERSEVLVLAVKPQSMRQVMEDLRPRLSGDHLIISIAAGVTIDRLTEGLGPGRRLIRVMPNTPALVSEGASAYAMGPGTSREDEALIRACLEAVGRTVAVPETLLDAVTGLSGSGPAFVYLMIEALSDGGVRVGLPRDVATLLAAQTVLGGAKMVLETGLHPGALKDQVTSPGGTTIAGLHALESSGLRGALIDAVRAATLRSAELAAISSDSIIPAVHRS
jgi:pyrroline-5-carboxylate reductase